MVTSCPFCNCSNITIGSCIYCVDNECFFIYKSSRNHNIWFLEIQNTKIKDCEFEVTNSSNKRLDGKPSISVNFDFKELMAKISNGKFYNFVENCRFYM